jgi:hypothetical protein
MATERILKIAPLQFVENEGGGRMLSPETARPSRHDDAVSVSMNGRGVVLIIVKTTWRLLVALAVAFERHGDSRVGADAPDPVRDCCFDSLSALTNS